MCVVECQCSSLYSLQHSAMQTISDNRSQISRTLSAKVQLWIPSEILHLILVGYHRLLSCIILTFVHTSTLFTSIVVFSWSFWQRFSLLLVILCRILFLPNFNGGLINEWKDMKCRLLHQSIWKWKWCNTLDDINIRHTTVYPILSPLP